MDIDDIRRANLKALVDEFKGLKFLAAKLERDDSQVAQWVNGSKNSGTGKPRGMRSETARYIEEKTGKPPNWLDKGHNATTIIEADDADSVRLASSRALYRLLTQVPDGKLGAAMAAIQEALEPFYERKVAE